MSRWDSHNAELSVQVSGLPDATPVSVSSPIQGGAGAFSFRDSGWALAFPLSLLARESTVCPSAPERQRVSERLLLSCVSENGSSSHIEPPRGYAQGRFRSFFLELLLFYGLSSLVGRNICSAKSLMYEELRDEEEAGI